MCEWQDRAQGKNRALANALKARPNFLQGPNKIRDGGAKPLVDLLSTILTEEINEIMTAEFNGEDA